MKGKYSVGKPLAISNPISVNIQLRHEIIVGLGLLKIQSQNKNLITANSHQLHYLNKVNNLTLF